MLIRQQILGCFVVMQISYYISGMQISIVFEKCAGRRPNTVHKQFKNVVIHDVVNCKLFGIFVVFQTKGSRSGNHKICISIHMSGMAAGDNGETTGKMLKHNKKIGMTMMTTTEQ